MLDPFSGQSSRPVRPILPHDPSLPAVVLRQKHNNIVNPSGGSTREEPKISSQKQDAMDDEAETYKLWRIRKTVMALCHDRGYLVSRLMLRSGPV